MTEIPHNERVSQLALESAYFEQKKGEALDLISQLSDCTDREPYELVFIRRGVPGNPFTFTFNLSPHDSVASEIFTKLHLYYRAKWLEFCGILNELKAKNV